MGVLLGREALRQVRQLIRLERQEVSERAIRNTLSSVSVGAMAYIAYTGSGGIPARSGTTPGTATCNLYKIVSGLLAQHFDEFGNAVTVIVYNLSSSAVAGNTYIQCKKEALTGCLVADFEDCT